MDTRRIASSLVCLKSQNAAIDTLLSGLALDTEHGVAKAIDLLVDTLVDKGQNIEIIPCIPQGKDAICTTTLTPQSSLHCSVLFNHA